MTAATLSRAARWTAGWSVTRDVRAELAAAAGVQRPVVAGLRVVVLGPAGVGATTVASMLALVLAHYRTDRVHAVDAAPGRGTPLADRVAGPTSLRLGATRHPFAVSVTDAGSAVFGPAAAEPALAGSHVRLLVIPASVDGDRWAGGLLDRLARAGYRWPPTDVVRVAGPGRTLPAAAGPGVRTHTVPYDPALAGAGPVRVSAVADATRRSFAALAAAVLTRPGGGSAGPGDGGRRARG